MWAFWSFQQEWGTHFFTVKEVKFSEQTKINCNLGYLFTNCVMAATAFYFFNKIHEQLKWITSYNYLSLVIFFNEKFFRFIKYT